MTDGITTAVLRPQTMLKPADIQPGLLFKGLVVPPSVAKGQVAPRTPVWFVVQALGELNGDSIIYGTSYDGEMFTEAMCFRSDFFILGWGSLHPRPTNPVIPALVPEIFEELRTMQKCAVARAELLESRAAGMKRENSNIYVMPGVEEHLQQKAELFAQRARMAANIITENLKAWGVI